MSRHLSALALLAALTVPMLLSSAGEPARSSKRTPKVQLWVAAYYYPFGKGLREWEHLMKSARRAPIVAIVNPNSGPGTMPDTNYVAAGESPFSHSALDIKTYAMALLGGEYRESVKRNMPSRWFDDLPHTHVALDDAKGQGVLFCNMLAERQG